MRRIRLDLADWMFRWIYTADILVTRTHWFLFNKGVLR